MDIPSAQSMTVFCAIHEMALLENENIYKDDKKRNVLYFKGMDFYKYQSYEALNIMKPNFSDEIVDLI